MTKPEKQSLRGNFDTSIGDNLMVVFEKCNPNNTLNITCKSKDEINKFMKGKYIVLLVNQVKFR